MFDQKSIAQGVARWTGLGVTLPKDLAASITVFEALVYTEVGHQPVFDIESVTTINAEDKIRELADQLVLIESSSGQSVLERAKRRAVDAAARRVNAHARAAVPEIIEGLTPEFDLHATAYASAIEKLGPGVPFGEENAPLFELTPENLVAWGPDAVVAYGQAQQEAAQLNRISSWVASISHLTGDSTDVVLRVLRPASGADLAALDAAHSKPASQTLLAIDPVLYRAARRGIEFGINSPQESALLREQLAMAALSGKAR